MSRGVFGLLLTLALAGCAPPGGGPETFLVTPLVAPVPAPAAPPLGAALPAGHSRYDNDSLARLFTRLAFEFEWGARRPHLVRFEAPIRVGLDPAAASYHPFLARYLADLRRDAGIDIAPAATDGEANVHVRVAPRRSFARRLRDAACVTTAGNVRWEAFAAAPGQYGGAARAAARELSQATIFIPDDTSPEGVRGCLLEEIPQALGLGNDLPVVAPSVFNDDGAHMWPTMVDRLMLRVLYAPELHTGLDARAAEARARALLRRVNPAGEAAPPLAVDMPRGLGRWRELVGAVFRRDTGAAERERLADRALAVVAAVAPGSVPHCHSLVTAARVHLRRTPRRALALLAEARKACARAAGPADIRIARVALEEACAHLRLGEPAAVPPLVEEAWPVFAAHGQGGRVAALYTIGADALALAAPGSAEAAAMARLARDWTDYAVGAGRRAADCRPRS